MDLPDLVASALEPDESVAARVSLGGEDALFVTSERSLVYRAEGLLSDESLDEYAHDVERLAVSEGRRKSTVTLDYGLDGERTLKLPSKRLDAALEPLLAGVLAAAGAIDADEDVTHVFRFSELTLVITTKRVVRHIGTPVWDEDFESYHYDDVTDLTFEEGSVATSVVLTLGDHQERFKAPNEQARAVREGLTSALLAFHDVESLEELRIVRQADAEAEGAEDAEASPFGEGPDPLDATPGEVAEESSAGSADPADAGGQDPAGARAGQQRGRQEAAESRSDGASPAQAASSRGDAARQSTEGADAFEGSEFETAPAVEDQHLAEEVAALREAVERQGERIERQEETIQQLIEELRRGR